MRSLQNTAIGVLLTKSWTTLVSLPSNGVPKPNRFLNYVIIHAMIDTVAHLRMSDVHHAILLDSSRVFLTLNQRSFAAHDIGAEPLQISTSLERHKNYCYMHCPSSILKNTLEYWRLLIHFTLISMLVKVVKYYLLYKVRAMQLFLP